jgi:hypothetical protein
MLSASMAAHATLGATEERLFVSGPCLDVVSRTLSGAISVEYSGVK